MESIVETHDKITAVRRIQENFAHIDIHKTVVQQRVQHRTISLTSYIDLHRKIYIKKSAHKKMWDSKSQ